MEKKSYLNRRCIDGACLLRASVERGASVTIASALKAGAPLINEKEVFSHANYDDEENIPTVAEEATDPKAKAFLRKQLEFSDALRAWVTLLQRFVICKTRSYCLHELSTAYSETRDRLGHSG